LDGTGYRLGSGLQKYSPQINPYGIHGMEDGLQELKMEYM